jgi:hypothetical protein
MKSCGPSLSGDLTRDVAIAELLERHRLKMRSALLPFNQVG